jgi:hypothetical protein
MDNHPLCISRDQIKEIYEPMGFTNYKISGRCSRGRVVLDYARYMVKPEYKDDFIAMMLGAMYKDEANRNLIKRIY